MLRRGGQVACRGLLAALQQPQQQCMQLEVCLGYQAVRHKSRGACARWRCRWRQRRCAGACTTVHSLTHWRCSLADWKVSFTRADREQHRRERIIEKLLGEHAASCCCCRC